MLLQNLGTVSNFFVNISYIFSITGIVHINIYKQYLDNKLYII